MAKLSHIDARGRAQMVGVGEKPVTHRVCIARGEVRMAGETLACIAEGRIPKGDVLLTARLAGIQAAKRTDEWIPLCHPLPLDGVEIELTPPSPAC
jgi:cyclic pyranopterin phosphate synthase